MGLLIDIPTIDVAKNRLCGMADEPAMTIGSYAPLMFNDHQIGVMLRSKSNVKPLIISPGNTIDMQSSMDLVMKSLHGYRLPEPTRLAHNYVNEMRVQMSAEKRI